MLYRPRAKLPEKKEFSDGTHNTFPSRSIPPESVRRSTAQGSLTNLRGTSYLPAEHCQAIVRVAGGRGQQATHPAMRREALTWYLSIGPDGRHPCCARPHTTQYGMRPSRDHLKECVERTACVFGLFFAHNRDKIAKELSKVPEWSQQANLLSLRLSEDWGGRGQDSHSPTA